MIKINLIDIIISQEQIPQLNSKHALSSSSLISLARETIVGMTLEQYFVINVVALHSCLVLPGVHYRGDPVSDTHQSGNHL